MEIEINSTIKLFIKNGEYKCFIIILFNLYFDIILQ